MIVWEKQRIIGIISLPASPTLPIRRRPPRAGRQDECLADLRGADLRGTRGITNEDPDRQTGSLEGATRPNPASCTKERGAQKRCQARYKLSSQDIDLRVDLDWWRPRLQLPHPGELPD
jgi:hypothetical protein